MLAKVFAVLPPLDSFGQENHWLKSATLWELFRITRELVASTIAGMDLPPLELAQVEVAFIGAGLL